MKKITIKTLLVRFITAMLLTMGSVSASAQYYMNVVQKNGEKVQYLVADIDSVFFSGEDSPYKYVDLGLSVKWATFNVGASKPEEIGDYYAWGEIEPKTDYNWSNYKWCDGSEYALTKYNYLPRYGGTVDNKSDLDLEDDVAHVKWGGSWRMPTKSEFNEICNKCTWTRYSSGNTEFNGVAGFKVTSRVSGYSDRFIFFPDAGGSGSVECWSSSLGNNPAGACYFSFGLYPGYYSANVDERSRCSGLSIRPVCP